ncbi:hypothetical protein [Lachnoclostridium sp. Marseille-P6806]|uniref:hypothetical protein n=1 Tax=Lachnoclostridium sp. Marseille-P6806 TaxID=2364793 RepID=UPI0010309D08|nr:hypothetical protein [Lachnoclostridium sp. Marseille-P6806]
MKRERFEERLLRIFAEAGYQPSQLLDITPEEMVEIPGITVPNIRTVLAVQNKALDEAYGDHKKVVGARILSEISEAMAKEGKRGQRGNGVRCDEERKAYHLEQLLSGL